MNDVRIIDFGERSPSESRGYQEMIDILENAEILLYAERCLHGRIERHIWYNDDSGETGWCVGAGLEEE